MSHAWKNYFELKDVPAPKIETVILTKELGLGANYWSELDEYLNNGWQLAGSIKYFTEYAEDNGSGWARTYATAHLVRYKTDDAE